MVFPATISNILHTDLVGQGGGGEKPSPVGLLIQILHLSNNGFFRNFSHLKGRSTRKQHYVIILILQRDSLVYPGHLSAKQLGANFSHSLSTQS